jgi:membrane-associated protein
MTRLRRRRAILAGVGVGVVALLLLVVVFQLRDDEDGLGLLDGEGSAWRQYVTIFLLIVADAVVPVFPSESTLNTASTLAAAGELELWIVVLAGALGAVVGDSTLYWIARLSGSRVRGRLEKAKQNKKVETGLLVLGESAPVLIVAGRYVPGLRFVVNATFGLAAYPYKRFLLWSAVGGSTWSLYTCLMAYWIGTALSGYPLASMVISGVVTSVFVVAVFVVLRRHRAQVADRSAEPATP